MSPLTTTLTFGPIDDAGDVCVKIIYDHRVLDGAYVARRLQDLEDALHGPVLEELLLCEAYHPEPEPEPEPTTRPHIRAPRVGAGRGA